MRTLYGGLTLALVFTACNDTGAPADFMALIEAAKQEITVANMGKDRTCLRVSIHGPGLGKRSRSPGARERIR